MLQPEFRWCAAKLLLDVLAEEGGILEAQAKRNFFDT